MEYQNGESEDMSDLSVQLKAFDHQVGGHFLLMKLTKDTVCKPLVAREHFFYDSIPQELRSFTPEFFGERERSVRIKLHVCVLCTV